MKRFTNHPEPWGSFLDVKYWPEIKHPEKYDLVCANILAHLLLAFRENIVTWVRPGGYLTLAGILTGEFDALSKAFQQLGFRELERRTLREWTSGLFRKE